MPTFGARWLIPRLTAFMRQRPDIHVEFLPHRQGYDFSAPSWTPPCASARACARQRRRLHRGPGHRARVQPQADTRRLPEDLLAYPLLHHTSALDGWRDWFEQAGCDTRRSLEGARFDQYALLSQAAAAGFGVALIPRCLVEDELRDGRLSVAVELPIRARMGYYLCYPEQKASLPTLQAFRAWLMEVSPPSPGPTRKPRPTH